jgi:hypothetical protein
VIVIVNYMDISIIFAIATKLPQEEHIDLSDAVDISFSNFLIEDRICA